MAQTDKSGENLTVKQQRQLQREAKVAAQKAARKKQERSKLIGIITASVASVAVLGVLGTLLITSIMGQGGGVPRDEIQIAGLVEYPSVTGYHVDPQPVDYEAEFNMNPPAGGNHWSAWLTCGEYDRPVPNERAVHALEHGAVWVTYNKDLVTEDEIAEMRKALPSSYVVYSPYTDLDVPFALSAWGVQLKVDSASDERVAQFISKFWRDPSVPEPNAACAGLAEEPGRIS